MTAALSTVRFTQAEDLPDVCQFLHEQLGRRFSPEAWRASLMQDWAAERPNHGTHVRHEGRVVGVLCAIYADQWIGGRSERVCNPHSWVVLEEHRNHSLGLLMLLLRQRGYHFTMFTPNPKVAKVFQGLRFRVLDDTVAYLPNLPAWPGTGTVVETDATRIAALLDGPARHDFEAHAHLPWLRFAAFGRPGRMGFVVYKRARWKKLPCAALAHVSDPTLFDTHGAALRGHLLRQGFAFTRVEGRLLTRVPALALRSRRTQPKLVMSPSLTDGQVSDLYSELMALDL